MNKQTNKGLKMVLASLAKFMKVERVIEKLLQ